MIWWDVQMEAGQVVPQVLEVQVSCALLPQTQHLSDLTGAHPNREQHFIDEWCKCSSEL